jgi:prefoldin subunit 5
MPEFDDADKEQLTALIRQTRALRKQAEELEAQSEALLQRILERDQKRICLLPPSTRND